MTADRDGGHGLGRASRLGRALPPLARRDERIRQLERELHDARERLDASRASGTDGGRDWQRPRPAHARRLVRESGVFDGPWYRSQAERDPAVPAPDPDADLVRHYLRHGAAVGLSPHPGFLASWYLARLEQSGAAVPSPVARSPLLHYLTVGRHQGVSPHPALDAGVYLDAHPEAVDHPGGALGHLVGPDGGAAQSVAPEGSLQRGAAVTRSREEFLTAAGTLARTLDDSRGHQHLRRDTPHFDHEAEAALKAALGDEQLPAEPPLVSIVLPTRDRAHTLGAAIDSVLAQTWAAWELLVVDDGSRDATDDLLASYDDERIIVLRHEDSRGVAAARNSGLDRARGTYVAYLDSDNTWKPDFLELMVRFMRRDGHRVAYAASALVEVGGRGRRRYRGMAFSHGALREHNFIDCIVLVHERTLLAESGGFDETLRRTVDWDLFLRLAEVSDFGYLPVVGTEYDVWDTRGSRITTDESVGHRHRVLQRTLVDWDAARAGAPDRVAGRVSVVVVARHSAAATLDTVHRCLATATGEVEVVVVDGQLPEAESALLMLGIDPAEAVDVHRLTQSVPLEVARNLGACRTTGDTVLFLPEGSWCEPGWQRPLVAALADHAVVQPLVMRRGGTVWSAGVFLRADGRGRLLYRGFPADAPEVRGTREVDGATAASLALTADTFLALDGFDPMSVESWTSSELSLRAAAATGRPVACVGASRVALLGDPYAGRSAWQRRQLRDNDRLQAAVWNGGRSLLTRRLDSDGFAVVGHGADGPDDPDGHPIVVHDRSPRPLRWAIKIGPADVPTRENWGDWHFAEALRDALERLGHVVTVDSVAEWYRETSYLDDVSLVLRGLSYYDPAPDHLNLMWLISHSDRVTVSELRGYDGVFAASETWCRAVSRRLAEPAVPLLQCTDQNRFRPGAPDRRHAHEVLAVANARGTRPTIAAALGAGVVPAVYGARWDGLLPDGAWKGRYIPNDELVSYYRSAGVVLNDHHEDMRTEGFLSNRLFDLTACGARVLSDHMPEIEDVFGPTVATWTDPADIPALVGRHLAETEEQVRRREELSEHVRRHHTFDARARTLSDAAHAALRRTGEGAARGRP